MEICEDCLNFLNSNEEAFNKKNKINKSLHVCRRLECIVSVISFSIKDYIFSIKLNYSYTRHVYGNNFIYVNMHNGAEIREPRESYYIDNYKDIIPTINRLMKVIEDIRLLG